MSGTQNQNNDQTGSGQNANNQAGGEDPTKGQGAQGGDQNQGGDDDSLFSDPEKVKKLVKDLRAENAKHRTKNKEQETEFGKMKGTLESLKKALGMETDEVSPEEQVKTLQGSHQALEAKLAMVEFAWQNGLSPEAGEYFEFLVAKRAQEIEEGDELSEEQISELLTEVKSKFAQGNAQSSTGVKGQNGQRPAADGSDSVTVEQFTKMNNGEKSALYQKNPELYNKLFSQAVSKKLI